MSLYDDKRFILSHIRHSFITCDDTGMCETVMLNEHSNRYPYESIYHHPFEDEDDLHSVHQSNQNPSEINDFKYTEDEINFLQKAELEYQSELIDEDQLPLQSLDIISDSYDVGTRRRSNTAQKLEKLKKERKNLSKTKVIAWKSLSDVVSQNEDGDFIHIKRRITDLENLSPEELKMLEYDEQNNCYYETENYRQYLFPKNEDRTSHSKPNDVKTDSKENDDKKDETKETNRPKSVLTKQIEKSPIASINPFNEFTRFDGRVSESNAHTKRVRIFFKIHENNPEFVQYDLTTKIPSTMTGINCGPNWIEIIVLAHARVCDLIGLICWNYTHLQIGPPLKPDLSAYALKIAEENGDVDNDFPSLTFTDEIKRYGFPCLALVSVETQIVVTVSIESESVFSQIIVHSSSTTLKEIVEQIKKKRSHLFRNKLSNPDCDYFHLEQRSQPGVALDLNSTVSDYIENRQNKKSANFVLIFKDENQLPRPIIFEHDSDSSEKTLSLPPRTNTGIRLNKSSSALYALDRPNTTNVKKNRDIKDFSSTMFDIMKAPLYQCFEVNAVSKLYNSPVEMGISETKLEITPKVSNRSPSNILPKGLFRFNNIKAMNINVEDVVECHIVPIQKQNKQTFKIVFWNGSDFKSLKFESDDATVGDIVFKLKHVMKLRTSIRRNEYNTIKNRKKNISTKVYSKTKISSGSSDSGSEGSINEFNSGGQESKSYDFFRRSDSKFRKFRTKNAD